MTNGVVSLLRAGTPGPRTATGGPSRDVVNLTAADGQKSERTAARGFHGWNAGERSSRRDEEERAGG